MRITDATSIAESIKQYATDTEIIAEIYWTETPTYYATKQFGDGTAIDKPIGSIVSIEDFSEQVKVGASGSINNISLSIIGIKDKYDSNTLIGKKCNVYTCFVKSNGARTNPTLMFAGKIASPILWAEKEDSLRFDVISESTKNEYGFSLQSDVTYTYTPDKDAIGKPWPIVFGKVINYPALMVQKGMKGRLTEPIYKGTTVVEVDGGKDFTQTTSLRLLIGKMVCEGSFSGDKLTLTQTNLVRYTNISVVARPVGDVDYTSTNVIWVAGVDKDYVGSYLYAEGLPMYNFCYSQRYDIANNRTKLYFLFDWGYDSETGWVQAYPTTITATAALPISTWDSYHEDRTFTYAITDSPVVKINLDGSYHIDSKIRYVLNYNTGTVLAVKAYRKPGDAQVLCNVPSRYYTITEEDMGAGHDSMVLTMDVSLSSRDKEEWSDQPYVSIASDNSSNTSDVIKYLFETFSDVTVNTTSFDLVKTAIANYPSNFVLDTTGETISICEDIAYQARCSIMIKNRIAYLYYISAKPTAVATLTNDDIELKTLNLDLTEDSMIITKYVATWSPTYEEKEKEQLIYRNNITQYGLKESSTDFFIYNVKEWVEKSAEFWSYRQANAWKSCSFDSFIKNFLLESNDGVTVDCSTIGASVLGIIENINTQPSGIIKLNLWLPILSGTTIEDTNAWIDDSADTLIDIDVSDLEIKDYEVDIPVDNQVIGTSVVYNNQTNNYFVNQCFRAKITNLAPTNGMLSVRRINDGGSEIDTVDFNVWVKPSKSTTAFVAANYEPILAVNTIIVITYIDGSWYMTTPTVIPAEDCEE